MFKYKRGDLMNEDNQWKILLIDDEADIREVVSLSLLDAGYDVITAPNGEMGIELCKSQRPHIVTTDIRMPGIDGIQVLEAVKKYDSDIEVIVITAFGEMNLAIKALQLDASDFVTKPINDESLHLALKRAKERYTARKQLKDYTALIEKEKAETTQILMRTLRFRKNLIESSMDGILACDESGTIVTMNSAMENLLGCSRSDVIYKMTMDQILGQEEKQDFKIKQLKERKHGDSNHLFLSEMILVRKDNKKVPVQVYASVIFDQEKEDGMVCFFRDLREIRRLEREFEDQAKVLHQDKMMSLGRLAASVVHEINNPLAGILNYIRLIIRIVDRGIPNQEQMEKFKRYLELVENETSRCSKIVSGLLTFSRKSTSTFTEVRIDDLLERSILLSRHKLILSNIELKTDISRDIPIIKGDINQLQQCMINLIFNAIDAMPDGGTLWISANYDLQKKMVMISVRDNGIGIYEENIPLLFEPFFTTKKEGYGVGLGLSTAWGIIERHNGTIKVESRPGQGATFTIVLPVS
jgi:two-component system, NtrC family, sensor kinase